MQNHEFSHKFRSVVSSAQLNVNNVTKYLHKTFTIVVIIIFFLCQVLLCHLSPVKLIFHDSNYQQEKTKVTEIFLSLPSHPVQLEIFKENFPAQKMLNCAGNELDNVPLTHGAETFWHLQHKSYLLVLLLLGSILHPPFFFQNYTTTINSIQIISPQEKRTLCLFCFVEYEETNVNSVKILFTRIAEKVRAKFI